MQSTVLLASNHPVGERGHPINVPALGLGVAALAQCRPWCSRARNGSAIASHRFSQAMGASSSRSSAVTTVWWPPINSISMSCTLELPDQHGEN